MSELQEDYISKLEGMVRELRQRIEELESTIKSHGIPVKSFSGGVAHYCSPKETLLDANAKQVEKEES